MNLNNAEIVGILAVAVYGEERPDPRAIALASGVATLFGPDFDPSAPFTGEPLKVLAIQEVLRKRQTPQPPTPLKVVK
jgi:hypothetical protein